MSAVAKSTWLPKVNVSVQNQNRRTQEQCSIVTTEKNKQLVCTVWACLKDKKSIQDIKRGIK
jgi:hypothetical protein